MSKVTSVIFRMYDTGSVGDCLLLLFRKGETVTFKMLIDCGGWNTNAPQVEKCVKNIRDTCGGELDLLVLTHEHEDHVSGFNQARDIFNEIKVKEVWMSWIEDKTDEIGKILKEKYGKKLKEVKKMTLEAIAALKANARRNTKVKGFGASMNKKMMNMQDTLALVEFEEGKIHGKNLAAKRRTNDDAVEYVRNKGKAINYRLPGEVISDLKGAEGMKFFILGPPRDADMRFFKIDMEEEEMYHLALNSRTNVMARSSRQRIVESGISLQEGSSPFGPEYMMEGQQQKDFKKMYESPDYSWRGIETDWQESAAAIALRVTALTNNTSLAMAVEFESGKVILLPADAQSGNWMGWHKPDVTEALKQEGGKDTNELLQHTVFYKVGHHGSHNGTASKSGLDLVPEKDLIAFMPLVQDKVPKEWGGTKNFPAQELYGVLIEKTKGRIVRTDEGIITDERAEKLRSLLSAKERRAFVEGVVKGDCFFEYAING
jgi:beta-lactamase superfamily II metal-dependent hydrolase